MKMTYGEVLQLQLAIKKINEYQEKELEKYRTGKIGKKLENLSPQNTNLRKRG